MIRIIGRTAALSLIASIVLACTPLPVPTSDGDSTAQPEDTGAPTDITIDEFDLAGEGSEEDAVPESIPTDELVTEARIDLAGRLSVSVDQIDMLEARSVTWPDASLGCAQPGIVYAQVAQDGLLIRLSAGGEMYFYHSGAEQDPFLCEETSAMVPEVTPKTDEFVPPPGSEID